MKKEKNDFLLKIYFIILSLFILILSFLIPVDSDVKLYHYYSNLYYLYRLSPYNNFFFVYPPIALFPILTPGMFAKNIWGYSSIFKLEMAIFWIISLCFLYKISKTLFLKEELFKKFFLFGWLSFILSIFIYNRIDIFIIALILASIYFLLKENFLLSSLFLSLSIWTKFYPIIFLPLFFFFILKKYGYKKLFYWAGSSLLIFCLFFLIFILAFSPIKSGFYSFFYHFQRPIHIESLYGGFYLLLESLKIKIFKITIKNDIYGWSLYDNPFLNKTSYLSSFLIIVFFAIAILKIIKNKNFKREEFLNFIMFFSLVFIILNKVFSPQYLIWLLPFVPLVFNKKEIKIFALVCLLTILIYPLFYKDLIEKNIILILILNIRNLILLFLTINFGRKLLFSPNKKIAKKEIPKKSN